MKTLTLKHDTGETSSYYINKRRTWTPYGFCVEYADYYEIAMHSWYMRIDKKTLAIVSDIKTVDVFETYAGCIATIE